MTDAQGFTEVTRRRPRNISFFILREENSQTEIFEQVEGSFKQILLYFVWLFV